MLSSIVVIRCNEGGIEDFDTLDGCSYNVEGKSNHIPR